MAVTEKDVRKALKSVKDPDLGLDLVVLGLIYEIEIEENHVKATMSLTSPFCPVAGEMVENVKTAIEEMEEVEEVARPNRAAHPRIARSLAAFPGSSLGASALAPGIASRPASNRLITPWR